MNRLVFILLIQAFSFAQTNPENLPFYEIEDYPETYTSNLIVARMIDGLGFRYYWATEGLGTDDLDYRSTDSSRSIEETINHIYGLSKFIRNSILEGNKDVSKDKFDFSETRKRTLNNFKIVSDTFKNADSEFPFQNTSVPFWNIINGPVSDALWHCGQVVMLRRASGNPFNSKVSVFRGNLRK